MSAFAASRLSVATCALSLITLASCRGAETRGDSGDVALAMHNTPFTDINDNDASHSPTVVAPTDTIFYSCHGGVTGGGRENAITGRGEILARQFELPQSPGEYRTVGTDSSAAAQLFRDLDRMQFRAMKPGEPSNMTCSVAISDARGRHEVMFTPASVPAALQPIVARLRSLVPAVPNENISTPPPPAAMPAASAAGSDSAGPSTAAATGDAEVRSDSAGLVPVARGLTLVSALHFPDGDRENRVVLTDVTPEGVTYEWRFDQHRSDGTLGQGEVSRFVSANDLAAAPRLNAVFFGQGEQETPGYTAVTISRSTFRQVLAVGKTPYAMTNLEDALASLASGSAAGLLSSRLTYRGQLTLASRGIDSIPVLLAGRRTKLPSVHLHGAYAFQEHTLSADYWVLADSAHPLLLKTVMGNDVFQMIRIDFPAPPARREEQELEKNCRLELPGVYFAFNSAELEPASEPALTGVATLLQRHPDWSFTIEGHTDSIGSAASNAKLSTARAEAVRAALVARHGVAPTRLAAAGFGATRPRESNVTIEGRARNRRVELARQCAISH